MSEAELWARLGEATGRERVDLLGELADQKSGQGDYSTAASVLESAVATCREIGDEGLAGTMLNFRGSVLFNDQQFEASVESYAAAADSFHAAGWEGRVPGALWGQVDALRRLGRWEEMLAVATNGLAFAEAEENGEAAGNLSFQMARALYQLDRDEEALSECGRARDFFRYAAIPSGVALVDDLGHKICMFLGKLDEALELATNCYVIATSTSDQYDNAASEVRLAETHLARGEFEAALTFVDKAADRFREFDDSLGLARTARLQAEALQGLDRAEEALDAFVRARVLFEANGYDFDARRCEVLRAMHLHGLSRFMEAEVSNRRLAQVFAADGLGVDEAWAVARQVDNLVAAGEWSGAVRAADEWYDRVGAQAAELRGPLIRTLANKAYALWKLGEMEAAFQIAEEALAMTSDDDFDSATATIFEVRGRYMMERDAKGARKELARAIALHLAYGSDHRARELSAVFIPKLDRSTSTKEEPAEGASIHSSGGAAGGD